MPILDRLFDFCLETYWIRVLWSALPNRCAHPECERQMLRWTEHEMEILAGPDKGKIYPICEDCTYLLRRDSFAAGASVHQIDEFTTEYRPPNWSSETEGT